MQRINYHHLLYFRTVVREGGVARAAQRLRLAQSTVSGQLRLLEAALGQALFERRGRQLALTETGRMVHGYAEEIFSLGEELRSVVEGRPSGRPVRLRVAVVDSVPKRVASRLLRAVLGHGAALRLEIREGAHDRLLAGLVTHDHDVVLSDAPAQATASVRAFSHLLGETGVTWCATPALARRHRRDFPRSLEGAPVLLPTSGTALRRSLDAWFERERLRPVVVAELDDSALGEVLGGDGLGLVPVASVIAPEVRRQHGLAAVGVIPGVHERFHAITVERRLEHPAVLDIIRAARERLFLTAEPAAARHR